MAIDDGRNCVLGTRTGTGVVNCKQMPINITKTQQLSELRPSSLPFQRDTGIEMLSTGFQALNADSGVVSCVVGG